MRKTRIVGNFNLYFIVVTMTQHDFNFLWFQVTTNLFFIELKPYAGSWLMLCPEFQNLWNPSLPQTLALQAQKEPICPWWPPVPAKEEVQQASLESGLKLEVCLVSVKFHWFGVIKGGSKAQVSPQQDNEQAHQNEATSAMSKPPSKNAQIL